MKMTNLVYNESIGEFEEIVYNNSHVHNPNEVVDTADYTIKRQFHEKKNVDVFVVKIKEKVSSEAFEEMRVKARKYGKGYYSSYRGVSGFVFGNLGDANGFVGDVFGNLAIRNGNNITETNLSDNSDSNSLYTITRKYHEKKDKYIYVVKPKERVDDESFTELCDNARDFGKGYYSSYRGVRGFVFYTREDAKQFAEEVLVSYM